MSRYKRSISSQGIYHIMMRGVNRQTIFESANDYYYFQDILRKNKEKHNFALYAFCLMDNHVHLLMRVVAEKPGKVIQRIGISYAQYYNMKYSHSGHLFGDRFRSEVIHDDKYFLNVLRYILRNPVNAGMVRTPVDYPYSSAFEYFGNVPGISDRMLAMELQPNLTQFLSEDTEDTFMEMEKRTRMRDSEAKECMHKWFGISGTAEFQELKRRNQVAILKKCRKEGMTISCLSRITGFSRGKIKYMIR